MVTTSQHDKLMSHVPSLMPRVAHRAKWALLSPTGAQGVTISLRLPVCPDQSCFELSFWLRSSRFSLSSVLASSLRTLGILRFVLMSIRPQDSQCIGQGHQTGFLSPTAVAVPGLLQIWNKMQQLLQSPGLQSHHSTKLEFWQ